MASVLLAVVLILASSTAQGQPWTYTCPAVSSPGNYTPNSTFAANLNLLLSLLPSNASSSAGAGYASVTAGSVTDLVHGQALCRGDVTLAACKSCLDQASTGVLEVCPSKKEAAVFYEDCQLRYSSELFLSIVANSSPYGWRYTDTLTSDLAGGFNASVWELIGALTGHAAYNESRLFATGTITFGGQYPKIYGLLQCTRDLSPDDCSRCLRGITGESSSSWFYGKKEGGVIVTSCNYRYGVEPFYSGEAMVTLSPSVTSPGHLQPEKKKKNIARIVMLVTIPLVMAIFLTLISYMCFQRRKTSKQKYNKRDEHNITTAELPQLDLSAILTATADFSEHNKLGEGGFGAVYMGVLPDGQAIAVKRLSKSSQQGIGELKNEVLLLAKLKHKNLVMLLGVCLEGEEKLLVYEYVANKSLDTILFDTAKKELLNWNRRLNIIMGIARGLQYLHEESQVKIIHRDLKASNVLLDAEMNPKISDFGLARLFEGGQTQALTRRVVGTFGYMPPEYVVGGNFSNKSDVFSFGILILEIVTGCRNSDFVDTANQTSLLNHVWENWVNRSTLDVIDPSIRRNCLESEAQRCIQIGLLCVQKAPADRPTMSSIVLMLSSHSMAIQAPSRPAFLAGYSQLQSRSQRDGEMSEALSIYELTSRT